MKKFVFVFLLLAHVCSLWGCEKLSMSKPEVQTLELQALSTERVLVKGNIVNTGNSPVVDYGFYLSNGESFSLYQAKQVSLGSGAQKGEFSREVDGLYPAEYFLTNRKVIARAYLTTSKETVYGEEKWVYLNSPKAGSITPILAAEGEHVTITGELISNKELIKVTFGDKDAKVIEASGAAIVVEVPAGLAGAVSDVQTRVRVTMSNYTLNVTDEFSIKQKLPTYSPLQGAIGSNVIIEGQNFPNQNAAFGKPFVSFDDVQVPIKSYSSTRIVVEVPEKLTNAQPTIKLTYNGRTTSLPDKFTVTSHIITGLVETAGLPQSIFTITGEGLSPYIKHVEVGGYKAYVVENHWTYMKALVPREVPDGEHDVTVIYGPNAVKTPQKFRVYSPHINSFSPFAGGIDQWIRMPGNYILHERFDVSFGAVTVAGFANQANLLEVVVPEGLPPGKLKLSVNYGHRTLLKDADFTVQARAITSVSPASGPANTLVTINTEGILTGNGRVPTVLFGTVEAIYAGYSENSLRVRVPAGVTPGAMKINLIYRSDFTGKTQIITSTDNFTVTP